MNISHLQNHKPRSVDVLQMPASEPADLTKVGRQIYNFLTLPPEKQTDWKKRRPDVEIKPDHLYSPKEVAAVLSVSYDTAVRIMQGMKRCVNLASPRAKKRLLRVRGSDLRDYVQNKMNN